MDPFERHLKEVFADAEVPIDSGKIWQAVEPGLPRMPRRPGIVWLRWFIALMVFVVLILVSGYFRKAQEENRGAGMQSSAQIKTSSEEAFPQKDQSSHDLPDMPNSQMGGIASMPSSEEKSKVSASLHMPHKRQHTALNSSASIVNKDEAKAIHGTVDGLKNKLLTSPRKAETRQGAISSSSNNVISAAKRIPHPRMESFQANRRSGIVPKHISLASGNASSVSSKSGNTKENITISKSLPPIAPIAPSAFVPLWGVPLSPLPGHPVIRPSGRVRDCYDFSLRVWRHELDVYVGPDYTPMKFSPKKDADQYYADLRERTESALESFSIGAQYNIRHRRGFFFGIGLNYSQIDEKFELNSLQTDTMFRNGVVRIDIDSTGKKHPQNGPKRIYEVTNWDKRTYNYYRFLSIPLTLGYGFGIRGFGIEPSLGLDINLFHLKKGEILMPDRLPGYITDGHPKEEPVYHNWAGLSITGGLKLLYPYSDRMDFFAEPYMRYPLKSLTLDAYPVSQKRDTYGLRLGLRVKL